MSETKLPKYVQRVRRPNGHRFRAWVSTKEGRTYGQSRSTPEEAHRDALLMRQGKRVAQEREKMRQMMGGVSESERLEILERETQILERRDRLRRRRGQGSRLRMAGCVYFIESRACGLVKIGFAVDVKTRMAQMRTDNPTGDLNLLLLLPGTRDVERLLHDAFALDRERGEWFRKSDAIRQFVSRRAEMTSTGSD